MKNNDCYVKVLIDSNDVYINIDRLYDGYYHYIREYKKKPTTLYVNVNKLKELELKDSDIFAYCEVKESANVGYDIAKFI